MPGADSNAAGTTRWGELQGLYIQPDVSRTAALIELSQARDISVCNRKIRKINREIDINCNIEADSISAQCF